MIDSGYIDNILRVPLTILPVIGIVRFSTVSSTQLLHFSKRSANRYNFAKILQHDRNKTTKRRT
jgi:hypothetical protein